MDTSHGLLLALAALTAAPILFAIAVIIASWRSVNQRALFSAVTLLSFYGLGSIVYAIVREIYEAANASSSAYMLPAFRAFAVTAVFVAAIGFPIAWRLRNAFLAPDHSSRSTTDATA